MKKIYLLLFLLLTPLYVNAEDNTYANAVPNPGYTVDITTNSSFKQITINGIDSNVEDTTSYFYAFTNDTTPPSLYTDSIGCSTSSGDYSLGLLEWHIYNTNFSSTSIVSRYWFMIKGYNNVWIMKRYKNLDDSKYYCEYISEPITVEKGSFPKLGERYDTFMLSSTNTFHNFYEYPYWSNASEDEINYLKNKNIIQDTNRYVKVGKITDSNLIYKLTYNKSGALEELLTYAKSANDNEYIFDVSDYEYSGEITGLDRTEGTYYYIYTYFKDPAFRDETSDVRFTVVDSDGNIAAYTNFLTESEEIEYNPSNNNDNDVENPKTGLTDYFVIGFAIITSSFILIKKFKRKFSN